MLKTIKLISSDWKRYLRLHKKMNPLIFLIVLFRNPGMHFSVFYRLESFLLSSKSIFLRIIGAILYPFYFIETYYILNIDISPRVKIGKGLYIHNQGIVVADKTKAGNNLSLIGPLTLGVKALGENSKVPVLGDNVTVYAGARIVGDVIIGDNVKIAANAAVVKNVPSNCIVGGVPAKIIKRIR